MSALPTIERFGPVAEPGGKTFLRHLAGGEAEGHQHGLGFGGNQSLIVFMQEERRSDKCRALVAIDKRVIADDAKGIGRSKNTEFLLTIGMQIAWSGKSRFQKPVITNAARPTMAGKLGVMDCDDDPVFQPSRFRHLASSASAFL